VVRVPLATADDNCVAAATKSLEQENAELRATLAERDAKLEEITALLEKLARDNSLLRTELLRLKRARYGPKSDRFPDDEHGLFAELFPEEPSTEPSSEVLEAPDVELPEDPSPKKARRKGREKRQLDFQALPREHVRHELPEEERICPVTGKLLVPVGLKVTEKLEHEPARLYVQVHEQVEYGLSEEDRAEQTAPTKLSPLPPHPIDGLLAGPGLLARVLVAKYVEHLPLHRQEAIFEREGLQIPRQTLCEWVMRSIELLLPIVSALRRRLLEGDVLQNDDTRVLCLENATRGGRRWAYLWAWVGVDRQEVVYQFSLGRDHEVVKEWIGPQWSGHLVGDGYAGYRKLCRERDPKHPIVEVGCWAHARRKVREAAEEAPKDAVQLAGLIRRLYAVEKTARKANEGNGLEAEELRRLRRAESLPVLWRIRGLVRKLRKVHAEEGAMGKALTYIQNQWRSLRQYVKDGRLPIDNNACEQAIRPVAVGRKNWLFTGSPRGGNMGAAIYSLMESCKRAGVDPYEYLRDVLVRIRVHPEDRRAELVPLLWKELRQGGRLDPLPR